jgi:hypothetical protein
VVAVRISFPPHLLIQNEDVATVEVDGVCGAEARDWRGSAGDRERMTKATSGINGALTRTQTDLGIQDSVKQFYEDTLKSSS